MDSDGYNNQILDVLYPEALDGMKKVMEKTASKRVCLRIKPKKIVSWDHAKLGGVY